MRQAVVRIRSVQSLRRVDEGGTGAGAGGVKEVPRGGIGAWSLDWGAQGRARRGSEEGDGEEMAGKAVEEGESREVTEYIVIQQRLIRGKEEGWIIWGTTGETRVEEWEDVINPRQPEEGQVAL